MTKSYHEEIFNFFTTSEENFLNLCKIAKHVSMVKDKLLEAFWDAVQSELEKLVTNSSEWKVYKTGPIKVSVTKLMLYKSHWGKVDDGCPQLAIAFERLSGKPFYGPFIHNRTKELNHTQSVSYLRSLDIASDYERDNETWYPFFAYPEIDFNRDDSFSNVLPARRSEVAKDLAQTLFDLASKVESDLDLCYNKFKLAISTT